jgi:hypothetical protein
VVSADGVAVNGCLLPHSRALSRDAAGRRLSPWPRVHFQLGRGELWLYAANDRSWDSRYWGPTPVEDVLARAIQLLVIPGAPLDQCDVGCCTALHPHSVLQGTCGRRSTECMLDQMERRRSLLTVTLREARRRTTSASTKASLTLTI